MNSQKYFFLNKGFRRIEAPNRISGKVRLYYTPIPEDSLELCAIRPILPYEWTLWMAVFGGGVDPNGIRCRSLKIFISKKLTH